MTSIAAPHTDISERSLGTAGSHVGPSITLYSKPACPQCTATKSVLDRSGVPYDVIDIVEHPEAIELLRDLGYSAAPVVTVGDEHWSGFRLARLNWAIDLVGGSQLAAA